MAWFAGLGFLVHDKPGEAIVAAIRVTSDELRSVSAQLSAGCGDIESRLTQLRSSVQGLVTGGWQGTASSAFDGLYEQWGAAAAQLRQALDGIGRQLQSAAQLYEQTESHLTNQLRG